MTLDLFTETGATFSECRRYRYRLWRYWDRSKPPLCFLMLNPSTADDLSNDPTVERCQRRALAMGFGGLEVVNIFAFRSTDPAALYSLPVGRYGDLRLGEPRRGIERQERGCPRHAGRSGDCAVCADREFERRTKASLVCELREGARALPHSLVRGDDADCRG